MKTYLLKNTKTGNEFTETEAGFKIRSKNSLMMDGIEMIGEIDPKTGEVDRTTAVELIEQANNVKFIKNDTKTTGEEKNNDSKSEEGGEEKGGDLGAKDETQGGKKGFVVKKK